MAEGREPLLRAGSSACTSSSSLLPISSNPGESPAGAGCTSGSGHAESGPVSQGMDIPGLKKRGSSLRSWTCVDCRGNGQQIKLDNLTMMRRCNLPSRDLRLLDPIFVYPSTILRREKAIVVNLEHIRCIITAEEVLLLSSSDIRVHKYVEDLQRRLTAHSGDVLAGGGTSRDNLPFEFRALEVALEAACSVLDEQAVQLERNAYPLLDEFTSKISNLVLEHVRRLKGELVALTRRVQKVRDEIEHLMDDDSDMAEMCLTEKKRQMESMERPDSTTKHNGLEMLLEAYFVVIDSMLNKLTSLNEYINNTEDFINIQLDNVRNQLIQCELRLTTAMLMIAMCGAVAGVFGMNFVVPLHDKPDAFKWVVTTTIAVAAIIFFSLLWFYKRRKMLPHCCMCMV